MEINYLRAFFDVARAGKFSLAAKKNRISVSALSRSVSLLEESEGVLLLERFKEGVRLTSKGHEVFRLCEKLFEIERELENTCRGVQEKCQGPLSFAISDHLIDHLVLNPLHDFRLAYPEVLPRIYSGTPGEIAYFLQSTDCEFALMFSKMDSPQFQRHFIRKEPMTLVVQAQIWRECEAANCDKTLAAILKKYGYISSLGIMHNRPLAQTLTEVFGQIPRVGLEVNSQEQQKRFCLAGEGVAYLARFMVEAEIDDGRLVEIPGDFLRDLDLWLVRLKGRFLSYTARAFLAELFPGVVELADL